MGLVFQCHLNSNEYLYIMFYVSDLGIALLSSLCDNILCSPRGEKYSSSCFCL